MRTKFSKCLSTTCPVAVRELPTVMNRGCSIETARFVVIQGHPSHSDASVGLSASGPEGSLLQMELESVGVDLARTCFTNITKCYTKEKGHMMSGVTGCQEHHIDDWEAIYTDKLLIVLGEDAVKVVLGFKTLGKNKGKVFTVGSSKAVCTWSADYIIMNMKSLQQWRRDLKTIVSLEDVGESALTEFPKHVVRTANDVGQMEEALLDSEAFSYDIETNMLDPFLPGAKILCIGFANEYSAWVLPINNGVDRRGELTSTARATLKKIFESNVGKYAINAKFDNLWLRVHAGVRVKNVVFDPQLAQHLLDEGTGTSVSLKQLVWRYFPSEGGYEEGINYDDMEAVPEEMLYDYCARDCILTYRLVEKIAPQIDAKGMTFLYHDICNPTVESIVEMEYNGVHLDNDKLLLKKSELETAADEALTAMLADPMIPEDKRETFNVKSLKQLETVLIQGYKLPILSMTEKGSIQINAENLERYASMGNVFARNLLVYRKATKIVTTYLDSFIDKKWKNAVHGRYGLITTVGGRLSSNNPNMQNAPEEVRAVFKTRFTGGSIVQMDFSQMEMRVLAYVTKDEGLRRAFDSGVDIHRWVMAEIKTATTDTIWSPDAITDEERKQAKALNFGLIYGRSALSIAREFGMSDDDGQEFVDSYFRKFPRVKAFQESVRKNMTRGTRTASSLFGRKRKLDMYEVHESCRKAFNFPIQSLASDLNLYVMNIIYRYLIENNMESLLIATVHDSIVIDATPSERDEIIELMFTAPSTVDFDFVTFPLEVDVSVGENWGELTKITLEVRHE